MTRLGAWSLKVAQNHRADRHGWVDTHTVSYLEDRPIYQLVVSTSPPACGFKPSVNGLQLWLVTTD